MSGGSWDYYYQHLEDVAERLQRSNDALRVAFGKHLILCSRAMKDIEWVDSSDCSPGDEHEAIRKALGKGWKQEVLSAARERAKQELERLREVVDGCE